jgi:hypothetical protein
MARRPALASVPSVLPQKSTNFDGDGVRMMPELQRTEPARRARTRTLAVALSVAALCVACGGDDFTSANGSAGDSGAGAGGTSGQAGTSGTGGSGGAGGAGGSAGDGGTCEPSKSPSEDACVITEQYGVFVSPDGDDAGGDGSQANPFRSLGKAVAVAGGAKKNVYACVDGAGYAETTTLDLSVLDGSGIFGGFDCSSWSHSKAKRAALDGASTALRVEGVVKGLVIEDFDVTAANATGEGPGASSFGAMVANSSAVVFRRVTLTAGDGASGAPGLQGSTGAHGTSPNPHIGKSATCTAAPATALGGDWGANSECGSRGGKGGTATKEGAGGPGTPGTPQTNVVPPNVDNGGSGSSTVGSNGNPGQPGSNGVSGLVGPAAAAQGAFTITGFKPASGQNGTNGSPGQGGGGGGASAASAATAGCIGASGGAGGMGGCGGTKGTGGGGGGASVALLSWQSQITLDDSALFSAKGGDGGKGGNAAAGGSGGPGAQGGGNVGSIGQAGAGGGGGNGGPGGSGSGGTGGASYPLVYAGPIPTKQNTVSLTFGVPGTKGTGGQLQGTGDNPAPDGSDGLADFELEL